MKRVLVADGDARLRRAARATLEAAGFGVAEASSGDDAARVVRQSRPDAVLCDLFMVGGGGLCLIGELRCDCPGMKVIATAEGDGFQGQADMLRVARLLGADALLRKPLDPDALLEALGKVL
jgi:CheY-like chemotaxis protein